jgi:hypothetical protein
VGSCPPARHCRCSRERRRPPARPCASVARDPRPRGGERVSQPSHARRASERSRPRSTRSRRCTTCATAGHGAVLPLRPRRRHARRAARPRPRRSILNAEVHDASAEVAARTARARSSGSRPTATTRFDLTCSKRGARGDGPARRQRPDDGRVAGSASLRLALLELGRRLAGRRPAPAQSSSSSSCATTSSTPSAHLGAEPSGAELERTRQRSGRRWKIAVDAPLVLGDPEEARPAARGAARRTSPASPAMVATVMAHLGMDGADRRRAVSTGTGVGTRDRAGPAPASRPPPRTRSTSSSPATSSSSPAPRPPTTSSCRSPVAWSPPTADR